MKKIIALFSLLLSVLLLASCSSKAKTTDKDTNKTTEQNIKFDDEFPKLTDTRSTETKMNTIYTINGNEVTYNMNTRKIVCIFGSQDVVSFGIKLLAYENSTSIKGYEEFYEGAKQLVNASPFSYEEVYSYHPELILVNEKMSQDNIKTLSKAAPVIPLLTDSTDFNNRLKLIGNIFGLQESAQTLVDYANNLKDKMLDNMNKLNVGDKTLTIYTYMGGISIPPERGFFFNTILFDYLKINRLDKVKDFMQDESTLAYEPIAASNIKDYEGDLVFFAASGTKTISTYVTENAGWRLLKAVREDRVGVFDMDTFAQKGVLLLYDQYSQILDAFKVALKA